MNPMKPLRHSALAVAAASAALCSPAHAFTFSFGDISGSLDSTLTTGLGVRTRDPSCAIVTQGASGANAPAGCLSQLSYMGDQGDLNYAKGDPFTAYLKGNHELLVKLPEDIKFMARGNWVRDFAAARTTGSQSYYSSLSPAGTVGSDGLTEEARRDMKFKARLLDLWVSKSFNLGGQQARLRVGNQVLNWGESLFIGGGINSTNAVDLLRLAQPGTQLKEALLPAPMVSFSTGLGHGLNLETYVQTRWNGNYYWPTGSYWSLLNGLGRGHDAYGYSVTNPRKTGQWGAALKYQPEGTSLNLGLYAMNYHDKATQYSYNTGGWVFPEDRKLYGISANFPLGDWAIGTELSYRPKDAVALNSLLGCTSQGGNCWVDEKRFQWHGTGLLSLTPSNARGLLEALGADTGTLLAEAVVISYPSMKQQYGGDLVSAGGWFWGNEYDPTAAPQAVGSKTSGGYNFDFSLTYDSSILPGWQVVPEIYFFHAVKGRTPNTTATFMHGAKSVNLIVSFIQNPANWQFGLNYAKFWGGSRAFDQPYRDRDFIGAYLSRNF